MAFSVKPEKLLAFWGESLLLQKALFALLSLLAPKKVTKKRHPLTGPVKRDYLVIEFFAVGVTNSSRFVGAQTCVALDPQKNL